MDTFILDVSDIPARNSGEVMCQLLSSQLADFRNSRHCGAGHCYSRSKEAVAKAIGAIYSRTKEAFRGNISGKHIDLTRQGNCLRQSLALKPTLAITRFDIRRSRSRETFRNRQILHFCQSKKTFRIGKLSHSLTVSFFDNPGGGFTLPFTPRSGGITNAVESTPSPLGCHGTDNILLTPTAFHC